MPDSTPDIAYRAPNTPPPKFWTEKRANLVFIAILLALTLPGMVMITLKKMQGEGKPTFPPGVRHALAYNDPTAGDSKAHLRVVPPQLGDWVGSLVGQRMKFTPNAINRVSGVFWEPVMSRERFTQLVASQATPGDQKYQLILWDRRARPIVEQFTFTAYAQGVEVPVQLEGMVAELLPVEVRGELQDHGFIDPPARAIWLLLDSDAEATIDTIRLQYITRTATVDDEIKLPVRAPIGVAAPTTNTTP